MEPLKRLFGVRVDVELTLRFTAQSNPLLTFP